jgi:septal ring factor EnvC (AmiA/AmiB activator)
MSAQMQEPVEISTDLVSFHIASPFDVFQTVGGLKPYMAQIREKLDVFKPDMTTNKGRDEVRSLAAKVAKIKVAMDNIGKSLVEDQKKAIKVVDANRKSMRDELDCWKDEVRAPLTEWEHAEKERADRLELAIESLRQLGNGLSLLKVDEIRDRITRLEGVTVDESWQEFEVEAARLASKLKADLAEVLSARVEHEQQLAEIAQFNAAKSEREQADAEQRTAREAAEKRVADALAENERLKMQAEHAEQLRIQSEQAAEKARLAEIKRQEDQQAEQARQAQAREQDKAHKAKVWGDMKIALMGAGITQDQAKAVVKMMATGQIPHIAIQY